MALAQGSGMKQSSCKNEEEVAAASWTRYSVRNINATALGNTSRHAGPQEMPKQAKQQGKYRINVLMCYQSLRRSRRECKSMKLRMCKLLS